MLVTKINDSNFKSRNAEIRQAQQIVRRMNTEIPSCSFSKYERFENVDKSSKIQERIRFGNLAFLMEVRSYLNIAFNRPQSITKYYDLFVRTLKNHMANCGELAELAKLVFGLNGKKLKYAEIIPDSVCHAVGVIPAKSTDLSKIDFKNTPMSKLKDVIVVDPWLGIADYAPNVAVQYESEYSKFIGRFNDTKNINGYYLNVTEGQPYDVDQETIKYFKAHYPNLFI